MRKYRKVFLGAGLASIGCLMSCIFIGWGCALGFIVIGFFTNLACIYTEVGEEDEEIEKMPEYQAWIRNGGPEREARDGTWTRID